MGQPDGSHLSVRPALITPIPARRGGRPEAGAARLLAAVLAVCFAGGQLLQLGHHLIVRHATCPEHGEPVHLTRPSADPDGRGATNPPLPPATAAVGPHKGELAGSERQDREHHDHCAVVPTRRDTGQATPRAEFAFELPGARGTELATPTGRTPKRLPVYLLAPKTSPPI